MPEAVGGLEVVCKGLALLEPGHVRTGLCCQSAEPGLRAQLELLWEANGLQPNNGYVVPEAEKISCATT